MSVQSVRSVNRGQVADGFESLISDHSFFRIPVFQRGDPVTGFERLEEIRHPEETGLVREKE